jgi:hypothetical protein
MVIAVDDEIPMSWIRLFNDPVGIEFLRKKGVSKDFLDKIDWIGISGAANLAAAVKYAKYYELKENDVVVTILTDSMEMYESRIQELNEERGTLDIIEANRIDERYFEGLDIEYVKELNYYDRKAVHNLKYYTWVEQQGKTYEEICAQWDDDSYWTDIIKQGKKIDELIEAFNKEVLGE